ncbi:MAG: PEP-CTERM sorting domain-containing protein [Microcystis sp.]
MKLHHSVSAGVALATLGTGAAQAALVVVPPGLTPGTQYRLVFVTEGTRDAQSYNIADYNTFVTNQARGGTPAIDTALDLALNAAGFNPNTITWNAIASTRSGNSFTGVNARDNTGTNPSSTGVPIYLIDGNRVANNNGDLWDGSIMRSINVTQSGTTTPTAGAVVWTGTNQSGVVAPGSTDTNGLGGTTGFAATGITNLTTANWIFNNTTSRLSTNTRRLYGMSSVLKVPVLEVPEPSSLLGFITLGGLMLGSAVRKARK